MGNNMNKLLLRQIKRHFGSVDNIPDNLVGILKDISNTYESFDDDSHLLQNSIEISSLELREAYQKQRLDAETQKRTINKIKEAIFALNPDDRTNVVEGDSSYLFESLIKLIEERKNAEEEIHKLSKAVEQNPASIVITNTNGDIEYVNPKFCDLTGYTREEVLGKNPRILKSETTPFELFIELWDTILSGNEWHGELQNKKKNGEHYWESALISPIINENRQITHFIAIKEDITERKRAEEERIRQTGLITSLLDSIPDIIFFKDTNGVYLGCNPPFSELVGKSRNEIIGKTDFDLFDREAADAFRFFDKEMLLENIPRHNEEWITYPNGRKVLIDTLKTPYWAGDGTLIGILGISRDITKRKEAEEALQLSSQKWEAIISASPDGIGMTSLDGKIQLMSEKLALIHGFSIEQRDSYLGKTIFDFVDPSNHTLLLENIQKLLTGEKNSKITEYIAVRQDGSRFFIDVNSTILHDAKGKPESILFVERDITERKLAEEALQTKSSLLEAQTNATIDGILIIGNNQKRLLLNQRVIDLFNVPQDIVDNEDDTFLLNHVMGLNKNPDDFLEKVLYLNEHQQEISHDILELTTGKVLDRYSAPVTGKDGKYYGRIWTFRDITESKQAEELLQNERALFRTIIDLIPDAVYVKDTYGRKILANPKELQFAGMRSEHEIIGKTDTNLYSDIVAKRAQEEDDFVLQTGRSILDAEGTLIDKDGKLHWLLISKVPLRDVHGKITALVGVTHDITAHKKSEDDLKQISTRLSLATRAGGVGVWDMDLVNNFLLWDDQMFALYGLDRSSAGEADHARRRGIHPDDESHVESQIKLAISGEKEFDTEFRVVWPDRSIHNIRAQATVQRDKSGNPLNIIGTNWDITEQKNTETTLLIAKLESDSANKAKSEFLANMSHEIRTPLNGVIGFTDLLLRTPLNKVQQQYAKNANTSGHSLLGIINDILDFSKIEAGKMELDLIKADIIELVELSSDIIKYHASQKNIELLLNIQQNLPRFAVIDPTRLKQILVNLLSNAIKFTESGEVELKVTFTQLNEYSGKFTFIVRDTGIGINQEQQKHLFKAFSQADNSTTRRFGGTGLGLTISNMLAEKMDSKIEVVSEPEKGSTFFFTLKTTFEVGGKLDLGNLNAMKRILVIDDNYNNRMILEHTCQNWGIEFVGIENGNSAIKLLKESDHFDVIIVDYQMPEINGLDTIKLIRNELNLTPEKQPIILLHSSSDDIEIYEECKKMGVIFNLTKPVKSSELLHYLKSVHIQSNVILLNQEDSPVTEIFQLVNEAAPGILVAEDVVINMILVTTLIKQMIPNVIIYEAKNGIEAFELSLLKKPDLIFMDIQMPVMSGIEATLAIRSYEFSQGGRIPIIALTAGAVKGEKERCLEAGMDDFLTKPLELKRLHKVLDKYLAQFYRESKEVGERVIESKVNFHFDRATLMESIGNSQIIFDKLLEAAYIQFSHDLKVLRTAITDQNLSLIQKTAHSIKGASLNMWFSHLAELAMEFELNLDKEHFVDLNMIYEELVQEWELVQILLKKE